MSFILLHGTLAGSSCSVAGAAGTRNGAGSVGSSRGRFGEGIAARGLGGRARATLVQLILVRERWLAHYQFACPQLPSKRSFGAKLRGRRRRGGFRVSCSTAEDSPGLLSCS